MGDEIPANSASPEPAPRPPPLDYGTPPPSGSAGGKVFAALAGAFTIIVVVAIVGVGLYPYSIGGPPSSTAQKVHWVAVLAFLALSGIGITGTALLWLRRPLTPHAPGFSWEH